MAKEYKAVCGKILGRKTKKWGDVCCLCFNPVGEDAIFVNDLVTLKLNSNDDTPTEELMATILISVLGDSIAENISMFEFVCKKCSQDAITSYKFIQNCKENTENLIQAVQDLTDCFEYISEDGNYETLYVSVDPKTKAIQQICDLKKQSNPQETALARFCFIAHGARSPFSCAVDTYTNDSDEDKKPRRRDVSTIFIKTHELIADPTRPKEYKCKVCLKLYPSSGSLRHHFFTQHFKKEFECPECLKSFGTAGILQSHMQISHQVVQCSECGKKLLNRASTLKRHAVTHSKSAKICYRCGRKYKKVADFERHMAQETCEVPSRVPGKYTCDHCDHVYTYKSQLMTHIRFEHQGEEGHVCKWCLRKCYTASALKTHILRHTKEKNHICQQCGGKFVTKQSLTNHMRLHTGERPYKCETCGTGFLSASRRKEHIERFHVEASFQCDLCPAKYSARRSLVKHRKRHFE